MTSQVLQWTQFEKLICRRSVLRVVALRDHLVDCGRAELLAGVAVLLPATRLADVRVRHVQVRRLVLVVLRARVVDVGQAVEGQRRRPSSCGGSRRASSLGRSTPRASPSPRSPSKASSGSTRPRPPVNICRPLWKRPAQRPCLKPWWKLRTLQSSLFTDDASTFSAKPLRRAADASPATTASRADLRRDHPRLDREVDALEAHRVQIARRLPRPGARRRRRAAGSSTSRPR